MSRLAAFLTDGCPVAGSAWRRVRDHAGATIDAAPWPLVRLVGGASMSTVTFLLDYEPVLAASDGDWMDECILRADVRAVSMVAETAAYPLTFAAVWRGTTMAEIQAAVVVSRGFICASCVPADMRDAAEVLRMAQYGRCRCGEPTRWYHVADEARVRAYLAAWEPRRAHAVTV